jgi:hypothetical protein
MRFERAAVIVTAVTCSGCTGDNSAVRAFHPTVAPGQSLIQVIVAGEQAQKPDIIYAVSGRDCGGDEIEIGRHWQNPYIRIVHPPPDAERQWKRSYDEVGYASRDQFARGLAEKLPAFYSCKAFHVTFGRYQGWPTSDSFTVQVDAQGRLTTVSPLKKDPD